MANLKRWMQCAGGLSKERKSKTPRVGRGVNTSNDRRTAARRSFPVATIPAHGRLGTTTVHRVELLRTLRRLHEAARRPEMSARRYQSTRVFLSRQQGILAAGACVLIFLPGIPVPTSSRCRTRAGGERLERRGVPHRRQRRHVEGDAQPSASPVPNAACPRTLVPAWAAGASGVLPRDVRSVPLDTVQTRRASEEGKLSLGRGHCCGGTHVLTILREPSPPIYEGTRVPKRKSPPGVRFPAAAPASPPSRGAPRGRHQQRGLWPASSQRATGGRQSRRGCRGRSPARGRNRRRRARR